MKRLKARLYLGTRKVPISEDVSRLVVDLNIESIITIFIYEHLKRPSQIEVRLIIKDDEDPENQSSIGTIVLDNIPIQIYPSPEAPAESLLSKLPAIVTEEEDSGATTIISGLCSVCRTIAQFSGNEDILGFKRGCLAAPSEASVWTKFCEIDILRFLEEFMGTEDEVTRLDDQLARFEMHLKQPVRIHNMGKVVQDLNKLRLAEKDDQSLEKDENDALVIKHQFVEGPRMFLADLILFSVFYFVFRRIPKNILRDIMPLTVKWYLAMESVGGEEILDQLCIKIVSNIGF